MSVMVPVDHHHRFDAVRTVVSEPRAYSRDVCAMTPVSGDEVDHQSPALGHLLPEDGEVTRLGHQNRVAGRQRIDDRRFPRAGAGRGKNDDRLRGLKDRLAALQNLLAELAKGRSAMIDHLLVHGPKNALGDRAGAGDLEEVVTVILVHVDTSVRACGAINQR
jgi:hypothetical protein